jgi:azurin
MAPAPAATAGGMSNAPAAPAMDTSKGTAVVTDCATEIEGTDAMQYNVSSIVVPSSCKDFKITLKHSGTMPVTAMGHDVVITRQSDMQAVDADGVAAGAAAGYVKPDDSRVIAHTKLIGGGETTSVSFPVSKIQGDGPYVFFCSFPGHSALMKGSISVQ